MSTTSRGYRYPAGTTNVPPDVRGDLQNLASDVNTDVGNVATLASAGGTDSGWSLSSVTLASGWTTKTDSAGNSSGTVYGGVKRVGSKVYVKFRAVRSGGAITSGATGNVADTAVATLASSFRPTTVTYQSFYIPGGGLGSVRVVEAGNATAGGQIVMVSSMPSYTISNGDVIHFEFSFPLN